MMLKTNGLNTVVHCTNICRLVASYKNLCLLKFRGGGVPLVMLGKSKQFCIKFLNIFISKIYTLIL
jgi:hypothetical protein